MARWLSWLMGSVLLFPSGGCGLGVHGEAATSSPSNDAASGPAPASEGGADDGSSSDANGEAGESDAVASDSQAPEACAPKSCAALGSNCGTPDDGCGKMLSCGTCAGFSTCGGGGKGYVCGCTPIPCSESECGTLPDGCGGLRDCGEC